MHAHPREIMSEPGPHVVPQARIERPTRTIERPGDALRCVSGRLGAARAGSAAGSVGAARAFALEQAICRAGRARATLLRNRLAVHRTALSKACEFTCRSGARINQASWTSE